ncbi:MAG: aminotransferase class V-fold PLP-dependent enzyme [Acetanaerobacterium sp.]
MGILKELGVKTYINAFDTVTLWGASRMPGECIKAIEEISHHFVEMSALQKAIGDSLAELTHNEAAFVTNGASSSLLTAACACMTLGDRYAFWQLPKTAPVKNEIILFSGQRNPYDKAIECAGATIVQIGSSDGAEPWQLEGAINERTAAVFYFAASHFQKNVFPLEQVIEIAKRKGIFVVVDAAAQLPPVENLWRYTGMGADLVLFSGGKTLCGPQSSGLVVGTRELIDWFSVIFAPAHGATRSSKVSREDMLALYVAVKKYLQTDFAQQKQQQQAMLDGMRQRLEQSGLFACRMEDHGPVGQDFPMLFAIPGNGLDASVLQKRLREYEPGILVGVTGDAIAINPINLEGDESETVLEAILSAARSKT